MKKAGFWKSSPHIIINCTNLKLLTCCGFAANTVQLPQGTRHFMTAATISIFR